jgi:hypothetical protein
MVAMNEHNFGGHPTLHWLMTEQGAMFPRDLQDLLGDFWTEEESIEDLVHIRECRDHS